MKYVWITFVLLVASAFGCTSSRSVNDCVTPGATYGVEFHELPGGTCGPIAPIIINAPEDGNIDIGVDCDEYESIGCIQNNTNCRITTSSSVQVTGTTHIEFSPDGSGGQGYATIIVEIPGQACASTYQVFYTKI